MLPGAAVLLFFERLKPVTIRILERSHFYGKNHIRFHHARQ